MRLTSLIVFSAVGLGGGGALAADIPATSAIDAVTVFPSGAEITRTAKVKIGAAGEHRIVLPDLPAQAIGNSVRVEGKATGKLEIGAVDTRRLFVPQGDPAAAETERRRIEAELETLRDTRSAFEAQVQAGEMQRKLLDSLADMPRNGGGGDGSGAGAAKAGIDWKSVFAMIGSGFGEARKAELDAGARIRETDRKIKDLEGKLAAIAPAREERTEVAVLVTAGAALDADLVVRYQVRSASWTPLYDARLTTGSKTAAPKLDLTRRAAITQSTGEAWTNVALSLSTTRPTAGAAAPEIRPLTVDYVPDAPPPRPVAAATPAPAMAALEGVQSRAFRSKAAADAPAGAMADAAEPIAQAVAAQSADVAQTGFQAVYTVPGRQSVAPTGEAKRVQLLAESIEPQLVVRTVPKLDAKAYLYAKLVLPKSTPVLAGAVSLFRDGTFVGTGRLPQLAPGEEHELGFGADDNVRVRHAIAEDKRGEKGIISSSKTDTRNFKITIKNLHQRQIGIAVMDQIPVSQNQDIKVALTAKPAPTKTDVDDKRGVLAWEQKLEPDQEIVIEHGYQVVWPGQKAITYR
jgi:uncharacterized protein (TIGR02231 family)